MKNFICSVAVAALCVGSLSSFVNAKSMPVAPALCYQWADSQATRIGFMQGMSEAEENILFFALYDGCMAQ